MNNFLKGFKIVIITLTIACIAIFGFYEYSQGIHGTPKKITYDTLMVVDTFFVPRHKEVGSKTYSEDTWMSYCYKKNQEKLVKLIATDKKYNGLKPGDRIKVITSVWVDDYTFLPYMKL